ncbi:MAG: alpha/beta hydrolase, partial [Burkholderiaceae bacterium]
MRATVALDSVALDVPAVMQQRHLRLYDAAFGADPAQWALASPVQQLRQATAPVLAVCSSRRRIACGQAQRFAAQGRSLGMRVE